MAGVGLTEAQARNTLGSVKIYTSDFRAMKNVLAGRNERGLYKMICDAETGKVVGLHMIGPDAPEILRSEEHTSELQSLMRISYAVFCLKKKKQTPKDLNNTVDLKESIRINTI